jgi:SNF2 family DNA or RNA helicase
MNRKIYVPRPPQVPMAQHLLDHDRCALWAGMGIGKTPVVETFLESLYLGGESQPTLILGPLRVARKVWSDEARKWEHLRGLSVVPIIGSEAERLAALRMDAMVYTTNYENLVWLIEHFGDRWPFRTVVADESDYIKGHRISDRQATKRDGTAGKQFLAGQGAKRAGALARIAHTHIKRFIELTGTPAPNGLVDLWGQLWYLDRGQRLGRNFDSFKKRWFRPKHDGYGSEPLEYADAQIHEAVKDICLTVDPKDWFDLKEPLVNNLYIDLSPKAMKIYKEFEKEMFLQIGDRTAEAFGAAARTQKCLQLANGAIYLDPLVEDDSSPNSKDWRMIHDEKLDALESIVHETAGANLMVCYEFKSDLARLIKAFPKGRVLKSQKDEDDFKAGRVPMLFLHPKSGGHGIDGFQYACNNIVFFGHNWSLGQYQQVIERIGPMRQLQADLDRPVWIHHIIARHTVDELVMERRESKREVQDILLEACKRR